ncbi:MAG: hypothetical protein ABIR47_13170 [Candidatus Kapaibacterium sp.]
MAALLNTMQPGHGEKSTRVRIIIQSDRMEIDVADGIGRTPLFRFITEYGMAAHHHTRNSASPRYLELALAWCWRIPGNRMISHRAHMILEGRIIGFFVITDYSLHCGYAVVPVWLGSSPTA